MFWKNWSNSHSLKSLICIELNRNSGSCPNSFLYRQPYHLHGKCVLIIGSILAGCQIFIFFFGWVKLVDSCELRSSRPSWGLVTGKLARSGSSSPHIFQRAIKRPAESVNFLNTNSVYVHREYLLTYGCQNAVKCHTDKVRVEMFSLAQLDKCLYH